MAKPDVYHIITILLVNLWLERKLDKETLKKIICVKKPLSKEEIIVAFHNNHYNFKKTKIFDPS